MEGKRFSFVETIEITEIEMVIVLERNCKTF